MGVGARGARREHKQVRARRRRLRGAAPSLVWSAPVLTVASGEENAAQAAVPRPLTHEQAPLQSGHVLFHQSLSGAWSLPSRCRRAGREGPRRTPFPPFLLRVTHREIPQRPSARVPLTLSLLVNTLLSCLLYGFQIRPGTCYSESATFPPSEDFGFPKLTSFLLI